MNQDPDALLGPCEIEVEVAGVVYTMPPATAADWIDALAGQGFWGAVVPGMLDDAGQEAVGALLLDDETFDLQLLSTAAREALAAAAGMKWWVARTLLLSTSGSWVMAEMIRQGLDPEKLSLGAWLAAAYRVLMMNLDEAKRAQIDMQIERRPPDVPADEWFDEDEAAAGFLTLASQSGMEP